MSRDELLNDLVESVGAVTEEETSKMDKILNDIVLLIQLRTQNEILIAELSDSNIIDIKREAIRRYKYG
ncbi:hypothetical protein Q5O14_16325 [Eubacteriaceae bacterium ES2]|nr:hypothetical protein Q5O14_16325 [Eubacteriaceae bacterium ES2]